MLIVTLEQDGNTTTVLPQGMLTAGSAPEFQTRLAQIPEDATQVILDCKDLRYTSSAGLRAILALQTRMDECGGSLVVRNINEILRETFDDTGFSEILAIE